MRTSLNVSKIKSPQKASETHNNNYISKSKKGLNMQHVNTYNITFDSVVK